MSTGFSFVWPDREFQVTDLNFIHSLLSGSFCATWSWWNSNADNTFLPVFFNASYSFPKTRHYGVIPIVSDGCEGDLICEKLFKFMSVDKCSSKHLIQLASCYIP